MKNILTFEDYRKMNIRQVESVIYHQFIEDDIKDENEVNEWFIRKAINKAAGKFIQSALADEIEKGKELEKSIKEALDGLNSGCDDIKKQIDANDTDNASQKLDAIEKIKEAIKAVQSQAFDTLTMIGSGGEIDFGGFLGSASVIAATRFGILLTPISSTFIIRKAYKYFLGIIKQTIRRNLLIIQLNFDQFENLILQKSFETDDDSEFLTMNNTLNDIISAMQKDLINKDGRLKKITGGKHKDMMNYLKEYEQMQKNVYKARKENDKRNPLSSLWQDQHNNTYTRTLEQIKQYINDDSQKELEALKNGISKMAGNDVDLTSFGELMIAAAEEYAIKTNHGINNNFIKMSSVFNLENQKKLIELIKDTQDENLKELQKLQVQEKNDKEKEELEKNIKTGKELYEKELKDSTEDYTLDSFEKKFGDDIKCLSAFFMSEDGKDAYEKIKKKNPLYKYAINDIKELNEFLDSINTLRVVEIESTKEFSDNIVHKDQALYYMMAEQSIKDGVDHQKSEQYFGFNGIDPDNVEKEIDSILKNNIFPTYKASSKNNKKKYFLKFSGDGESLFNVLHNDFKTEIFNGDTEYLDSISVENKENILKLIYKNFKIGKGIITRFAEYLVRLEAHMLLTKQDPYFIVENNEELKGCFKPDSTEIQNKHAFVEISSSDYEDIKKFLSTYHQLYDNDFSQETKEKDENKYKDGE